jgi:hypothetical protein
VKAIALAVLVAGMASSVLAQSARTGRLRGIVKDLQGRPVSDAKVTVTSPALQGRRTKTTGSYGDYAFEALPPGDYQVTLRLSGADTTTRSTHVWLGLPTRLDVTIGAAESVTTPATASSMPSPIESPIVGATFAHQEVEALAIPRTLVGIAQLSAGLTTITPNAAQVSISVAFAFDNVFTLDGVEVNDNPLGSPQNLFVEDAIAETQTLTSGMSAEYGRFSGGVVNAVTRSGGDRLSGSLRDELTNQRWSTRTPYEIFTQARHKDEVNSHVEGTVGGPIARSRVWVFGAGRFEKTAASAPLAETGAANTETDRNQRGELKLTATIESKHTVQAGYMSDRTENEDRPSLTTSIDPFAVGNRTVPASFAFFHYQGVVANGLLFQTQYSQQQSGVRGAGGTSRDIVNSPFVTLGTEREYNARYFDASDLEQRLRRQLALSAQRDWTGGGRHAIRAGYDWLRSRRTGGNEPSSTDYVFDGDYALDPRTELPALDSSGHLVPLFVPGDTRIEHSLPVRGSVFSVRTQAVYAQDHWAIDEHWSADLGVRYERVSRQATGGAPGLNTHSLVPRVAGAYDVKADGHYVVHVTYGRYSGRFNEALIGASDSAGSVDTIFSTYKGPRGQGRGFAPGFDPANYTTDTGRFPTANVSIAPGFSAPITGEVTASFGSGFGNRGFAEATYVKRSTGNIIEDFIDINNGTTEVVRTGIDFGKVTNIVYANTDLATRDYQALVLQTRFKVGRRWYVGGHYTVMLKDEGNRRRGSNPVWRNVGDWQLSGNSRRCATCSGWKAAGLPAIQVAGLERLRFRPGPRRESLRLRPVAGGLRAGVQPARQQSADHRNAGCTAGGGRLSGRSRRAGCVFRRTRLAAISRLRAVRHVCELRHSAVPHAASVDEGRRVQSIQQHEGNRLEYLGAPGSERAKRQPWIGHDVQPFASVRTAGLERRLSISIAGCCRRPDVASGTRRSFLNRCGAPTVLERVAELAL